MPYAMILLLLATLPGHRDWTLVPKKCESCHVGHGISGEKLLPMVNREFCLQCHGGAAAAASMVQAGKLAPQAKPADLKASLNLPYAHDESAGCLACHTGHGVENRQEWTGQGPRPGSQTANQYEYEACRPCHAANPLYQSPLSYHPVIVHPGSDASPSLLESAKGKWIACSSCHGAHDAAFPPGIHGSLYPAILARYFALADGEAESEATYAICYGCHSRDSILADESFRFHKKHITDVKASCHTCHESHASVTLPYLLAFEESSRNDIILPDHSGRRTFEDTGDRSGVCYLTCHNVEHDGWAYGPKGEKRSLHSERIKRMPGARKAPAGIQPKK